MRILLLCLTLAGCTSAGGTIPLGGTTVCPDGWTQYCARNYEMAECN